MSQSQVKKFNITTIINGNTFKKRTNNVEETLLSLKPELVLCEMYLTIKSKETLVERKLTAQQARKFFNDEVFREVFMNNLLLT